MASAAIRFNDGSGQQTITTLSPLGRFNRWRPLPDTIGERANALGDGRLYQWSHRTDYGASFELPDIAHTESAKLQDFLLWANQGGSFAIDTADSESNSFADVQVAPGTRAELSEPDRELLTYTLTLSVINVAASPTRLRCVY
jgi:hypothetical protein